jgi:hypothetical protein
MERTIRPGKDSPYPRPDHRGDAAAGQPRAGSDASEDDLHLAERNRINGNSLEQV